MKPGVAVKCAFLILLAGCVMLRDGRAEPPQDDAKAKQTLVTQKLGFAQKILAAVAQNDYSMVETNAQNLINNSKELTWQRIRSERYEELGKEYRRELENLAKAGKAKNNDAMALGYVKVSLACFNCHNHVREIKIADR
jgi:cytochrome c556